LTDLNEDLVVLAEDDSEAEFNDLDLDTFTTDLLNDNDWLRAAQTQKFNFTYLSEYILPKSTKNFTGEQQPVEP